MFRIFCLVSTLCLALTSFADMQYRCAQSKDFTVKESAAFGGAETAEIAVGFSDDTFSASGFFIELVTDAWLANIYLERLNTSERLTVLKAVGGTILMVPTSLDVLDVLSDCVAVVDYLEKGSGVVSSGPVAASVICAGLGPLLTDAKCDKFTK